ncbi:MAG TPA: hypothetical protein VLO11_09450 [Luteolibacter sp.]|nr:hypothetical protein [Luteolibacter sp.]
MKLKSFSARIGGCAASLIALTIATTSAQVTVDAVRDVGEGYSELAVQDQTTNWGGGNSLANIHTEQTTKLLNLFVSGRANGNAIIVFVDSKAGGVSFIRNNLIQSGGFEADINNLGETDSAGMTFEAGFEPDYAIRVFGTGSEAYASLYDLQKAFRVDLGQVDTSVGNIGSHGPVSAIAVEWEDVDTGDPASAVRGVEMSLNMALLGVAEGEQEVRLMAMLINGDSSFGSNQVLGSLDSSGDMGGDLEFIDFETDYASVQTLTVGVDRPTLVATDDEDGDGLTNDIDPQPLAQTRDIEFSVNMAVQEAKGLFTVGSTVEVQFFSGSQTPLSTLTLTDPDADMIYTGTLVAAGGFEGESFGTYKFRTDDPNSPNTGYEFGFDRTFTLGTAETTQTLDTVFFSNDAGYGSWADANVGGQPANQDFDGDGIDNGAEYFMGTPGNAFTTNPPVVAGVITWPRAADTAISSFRIEVSSDLVSWQDAAVAYPANLSVSDTEVSFTLPTGAGKIFSRLSVTP